MFCCCLFVFNLIYFTSSSYFVPQFLELSGASTGFVLLSNSLTLQYKFNLKFKLMLELS